MTEEEVLNEIVEKEYMNEEMTMFREHLNVRKLAAFLAEHIPLENK